MFHVKNEREKDNQRIVTSIRAWNKEILLSPFFTSFEIVVFFKYNYKNVPVRSGKKWWPGEEGRWVLSDSTQNAFAIHKPLFCYTHNLLEMALFQPLVQIPLTISIQI